jgi:hypothetical protein
MSSKSIYEIPAELREAVAQMDSNCALETTVFDAIDAAADLLQSVGLAMRQRNHLQRQMSLDTCGEGEPLVTYLVEINKMFNRVGVRVQAHLEEGMSAAVGFDNAEFGTDYVFEFDADGQNRLTTASAQKMERESGSDKVADMYLADTVGVEE